MTDSFEVVSAMVNDVHDKKNGSIVEVTELRGMFFMHHRKETFLPEGHLPIWRTVIELSKIGLHDLHRATVGRFSIVHGYTVDSIKISFPNEIKFRKQLPGDYHMESKCNVRGQTTTVRDGEKEYVWTPPVWKEFPDVAALRAHIAAGGGAMITGIAGSGKTTELTTIYEMLAKTHSPKVMCWTNRAVENINLREPAIKAVTFDHAYPKEDSENVAIAKYSKLTHVIVDEFSMVGPKWMGLFWRQRCTHLDDNGNMRQSFLLFGDNDQTAPMFDKDEPYNLVNYETSSIAHALCDGYRFRMEYKPETSRYDEKTYSALTEFKNTMRIDVAGKSLHKFPLMTLCKTAQMRQKVNESAFAHWAAEGKHKVIEVPFRNTTMRYFIGMPLIAHKNKKARKADSVVNSHMFTLLEITATNAKIRNESNASHPPIIITLVDLCEKFRYGWCETITRWQGGDITHNYNIIECRQMTYNDLNTAIGRTRKWESIGINPVTVKPVYSPVSFDFTCRKIEVKSYVELGYIYEKRDADGKLFYIGRTNNAERREEEHKRNPTNAGMEEKLKEDYTTTTFPVMATKRQLDRYEEKRIYEAVTSGEQLENVKKMKAAVKAVETRMTTQTEAPVMQTRFEISEDADRRRFRIRWNDSNGKRKDKEFSWVKKQTREQALEAAKAFQTELSREYIGVGARCMGLASSSPCNPSLRRVINQPK